MGRVFTLKRRVSRQSHLADVAYKKHTAVNQFRSQSVGGGRAWSSSDLGQLGGADERVGLLEEAAACALVVVGAGVRLCIAVGGTEVLPAPALVAAGQARLLATVEAVFGGGALLLGASRRSQRRQRVRRRAYSAQGSQDSCCGGVTIGGHVCCNAPVQR